MSKLVEFFSDAWRALLIGTLLWLLVGCACTPTVEYRTAKVPEPPVIEVPVIEPATTGEEKANALASYIVRLKAALAEALKALDAYRSVR